MVFLVLHFVNHTLKAKIPLLQKNLQLWLTLKLHWAWLLFPSPDLFFWCWGGGRRGHILVTWLSNQGKTHPELIRVLQELKTREIQLKNTLDAKSTITKHSNVSFLQDFLIGHPELFKINTRNFCSVFHEWTIFVCVFNLFFFKGDVVAHMSMILAFWISLTRVDGAIKLNPRR